MKLSHIHSRPYPESPDAFDKKLKLTKVHLWVAGLLAFASLFGMAYATVPPTIDTGQYLGPPNTTLVLDKTSSGGGLQNGGGSGAGMLDKVDTALAPDKTAVHTLSYDTQTIGAGYLKAKTSLGKVIGNYEPGTGYMRVNHAMCAPNGLTLANFDLPDAATIST